MPAAAVIQLILAVGEPMAKWFLKKAELNENVTHSEWEEERARIAGLKAQVVPERPEA